ncbi:MAG: response regulator [Thermotogae bacterium]|nr:response regulator [Thermotogota bacterium]
MACLMVVEDDRSTREMIVRFLKQQNYEVIEACDGLEALEHVENHDVDLVLMDVSIPHVDGIEVTRLIKQNHPSIIVIMLTAFSEEGILKEAAKAGADDFVMKPIDFNFLDTRIKLSLNAAKFHIYKSLLSKELEKKLKASEKFIENLMEKNTFLVFETLEILSMISEYRDYNTHEHTMRVGWLSSRIAEIIGLDADFVTKLQLTAPLHDIGKIGIPDVILLKPAALTEEEREVMKKHAEIGWKILKDSSSELVQMAATIALSHHERWNGSGYPRSLRGYEIPVEGLIVGIADSFDAIVSERPYKRAIPIDEAFEKIKVDEGELYPSELVKALFSIKDEIFHIYLGK